MILLYDSPEDKMGTLVFYGDTQDDEYAKWFDCVITDGIATGEFTVEDPKIVRMIILGAMNWLQQWYKVDGEKSIQEIQQLYAEYLLKMVK